MSFTYQLLLLVFGFIQVFLAVFFGGGWAVSHTVGSAALGLFAAWAFAAVPGVPLSRPLKWGVLVPVAASLFWGVCQMLPLLGLFHPLYSLVEPMLWPAVTLNLPATFSQVVYALNLALGVAALHRCFTSNPGGMRLYARVAACGVLAVAAYGLVAYVSGNTHVLWVPKTSYQDSLTASFINRNHYATFAGLGLLTCMALFFERVGEISSRLPHRQRIRALVNLVIKPNWPWLVGALVLLITVVLSTSRAGLFATVLGMMVFMAALAGARRAVRWYLAGMGVGLLLVAMLLLAFTGDVLGARLYRVDADTQSRSHIYALAQSAIADHPITGQGFGAFESIFNLQRNTRAALGIEGRIDHAHNTYLELAAELGLPAALLLAGALLTVLFLLVKGLKERRRGVAWPALGLSSLALMACHALYDFSLSMPAVALLGMSLLALGVAGASPVREGAPRPAHAWWRWALPPLALVPALAAAWMVPAAWHAWKADATLNALQAGEDPSSYTPLKLFKARQHLLDSLSWNPWQPQTLHNLARLEMALARQMPQSAVVYQVEARKNLRHSLSLSPSSPAAWFRLAWLENTRNNSHGVENALVNSLLTGAYERRLLLARTWLLLSAYPAAREENRQMFALHINNLWQMTPGRIYNRLRYAPEQQETLRAILARNPRQNAASWRQHSGRALLQSAPAKEGGTP